MSNDISSKRTTQPLDLETIAPMPNESEAAKQITKFVNAAGSKIEETIRDIKEDAKPAKEGAKRRLGATIAADIFVALTGAAVAIAGGPVGIAAGVAMVGAAVLHATTATIPAARE